VADIALVRVIGVIDLKNGKAVHARGGSRELYAPVHSALLPEGQRGDALALSRAYRDRLGLAEIYVADLDRIVNGGALSHAVKAIAAVGVPLMVDAAAASIDDAWTVLAAGARRVVVGLETLTSLRELDSIVDAVGADRVVFSLDVRGERVVTRAASALAGLEPLVVARQAKTSGAASLLVLNLARVGQASGPDVSLVQEVRRACPDVELIAGGGVRDSRDVGRLAAVGCDAVLVGTALHGLPPLGPV
jgi:phosphoribosylformimino-5-aminoimidazole carboxamide ribotide isomerase